MPSAKKTLHWILNNLYISFDNKHLVMLSYTSYIDTKSNSDFMSNTERAVLN